MTRDKWDRVVCRAIGTYPNIRSPYEVQNELLRLIAASPRHMARWAATLSRMMAFPH
jgi:hypothetical protein